MKSILSAFALTLSLSVSTALIALPAQAQQASALSFNASVSTDYRYRGISQSRLRPALQGGADYDFGQGFYAGVWGSTIKWVKDGGGAADVEIDLYGGYRTELTQGLILDAGLLRYYYPSNKLGPSANTLELYGALSFGPLTAKYSHSMSNLFGFAGSKNSGYLDLSASFELGGGLMLAPHIGRQTVKRNGAASYTDYALTLSQDMAGLLLSGSIVAANTKAYTGPGAKDLGKTALLLSVKKSF
jgi:uncharacterized protein (TIGR02001 family)